MYIIKLQLFSEGGEPTPPTETIVNDPVQETGETPQLDYEKLIEEKFKSMEELYKSKLSEQEQFYNDTISRLKGENTKSNINTLIREMELPASAIGFIYDEDIEMARAKAEAFKNTINAIIEKGVKIKLNETNYEPPNVKELEKEWGNISKKEWIKPKYML